MLDNKVSTAANNSLETSAHETGINFSTLTPYEYFHSMGIDLQGFSIRILGKRRKNGVAITGVFNISGIYYTVGAEDYEHLLVDLLERYREKRAYHKRCRNGNVSGTCFRSSTVIRTPWYFRHTFPDLHLSYQLYTLFPVVVPSGIIAFLYSDLRTFRSVSSPWYLMILPYFIPRTPWNKKISNIEGILKGKYFKRGIQQSNRPTRERILKCNSLLYSSIYFLFNHIYILQWRCLVGRCWTCWIAAFQPSNWLRPTKTAKNAVCWTCWTSSNSIFFTVNLYN